MSLAREEALRAVASVEDRALAALLYRIFLSAFNLALEHAAVIAQTYSHHVVGCAIADQIAAAKETDA